MRGLFRTRRAAGALALALAVAFYGCGRAATPLSDLLKAKGVTAEASANLSAEVLYLSQSKGSNYLSAQITGEAVKPLLDCLTAGTPADKPKDKQYSPELRCDCELAIACAGGESLSLYYDSAENLLALAEVSRGKNDDKDTLIYRYFTPGGNLKDLVAGLKQGAKLKEETSVQPFRSMIELKASIAPEELAEEGQELAFEFFSGAVPEYTGTACSVYTTKDFAAVPEDSCLITTYGKSKAGAQQKLAIVGLEANSQYTKIMVTEPDDALDSVDTGDEAPDAFAIVVKKAALSPDKWLVFVGDSGQVLDVILPDGIDGLREAAAAATPQPTEEPDAIE